VAAKRAAAPDAMQVLHLASDARIGLLHIQILLAPHIAEESDARADQLEVTMAGEVNCSAFAATARGCTWRSWVRCLFVRMEGKNHRFGTSALRMKSLGL